MTNELTTERLRELLAICESASTGEQPWREGTKNVWCETTNECVAVTYLNRLASDKQFAIAAHIAAFDPTTCAALVRRLIALEHGEYICSRCHLRKDAEKDFTEPPF